MIPILLINNHRLSVENEQTEPSAKNILLYFKRFYQWTLSGIVG